MHCSSWICGRVAGKSSPEAREYPELDVQPTESPWLEEQARARAAMAFGLKAKALNERKAVVRSGRAMIAMRRVLGSERVGASVLVYEDGL